MNGDLYYIHRNYNNPFHPINASETERDLALADSAVRPALLCLLNDSSKDLEMEELGRKTLLLLDGLQASDHRSGLACQLLQSRRFGALLVTYEKVEQMRSLNSLFSRGSTHNAEKLVSKG